jgi:hypothetical protein
LMRRPKNIGPLEHVVDRTVKKSWTSGARD